MMELQVHIQDLVKEKRQLELRTTELETINQGHRDAIRQLTLERDDAFAQTQTAIREKASLMGQRDMLQHQLNEQSKTVVLQRSQLDLAGQQMALVRGELEDVTKRWQATLTSLEEVRHNVAEQVGRVAFLEERLDTARDFIANQGAYIAELIEHEVPA
ncbi:MAG: hypothetical protein KGK08_15100 [Acidobacteriota bacterium]|nr:hypothetical protein [Acidobacteriota bacterium]